ncbi:hypothetical protein AYL99_10551 [Fonsecaea erecta]|uniref:Uncharacterized protein n=1 Tax=Fonsecaea erecta TaxID=1367422 RepID=A0A178Z721_9EURO|nr:hypothetical protein AYL99_10551 [Fonsecaea erecta]OAP55578.1 hypothetical protein AYL99_10551 [Fonsecaea erecta]
MVPLSLFGMMAATLALIIRLGSALPIPDPILPKITIRHDFPLQAPRETGAAADVHVARETGTHGKRWQYSLSDDIRIAPTSTHTMLMPTRYIQSQRLQRGAKEHRPRPRFYPFDTGNVTNANDPQITQVLSPSPGPGNGTNGIDLSSPSSQNSSSVESSDMQASTVIGTATALSSATFVSDIVTDSSPPVLSADSTLTAAAWVRTLPPTTALSTPAPPVPEPQPNLVTQSWYSGTTSPSAAETSSPGKSGNADCPFQSGTPPTPSDADMTPDPSFPVIVTIFPITTTTSAVVV